MNKRQLVHLLAKRSGLKKKDIQKTVDMMIDTILEEIEENKEVRIRGLGVFHPVYQDTRLVRNPKTGEEKMFTPRNNMRFRTGDDVVRKLNKM